MKILLAGPYFTNYSLAKVNRGLAVSLQKLHPEWEVVVWKNPEIDIDYVPQQSELPRFPELASLLSNNIEDVDVSIYCSFPSDPAAKFGFSRMPGKLKLAYQFWEETIFPEDKVAEINAELHGVISGSSFVKDVLTRNGVKVPIMVALSGINDNQELIPKNYPINTKKRFKFFHNSTAKQRKGVDVLLKAYFAEFNQDDDVSLIIKSFPGPENRVDEMLSKLKKGNPDSPEVIHISQSNLTEQEMVDLTSSCNCGVYPTRAEGFGMPIAEAMYAGKPVIVTAYSSVLDFCNHENSLLLDYEMAPAIDSEASNIGAKWAEPNQQDLQAKMRYVFENPNSPEMKAIADAGKLRAQKLTWRNSAIEITQIIETLMPTVELKKKKLAIISTINTVCGIAEYSRDLYGTIEKSFAELTYVANSDVSDRVRDDNGNAVRLWEYGEQGFEKVIEWVNDVKPDILHIQMHTGHYPPSSIQNLLAEIRKQDKTKVVITPHTVKSPGYDLANTVPELASICKLLVHREPDLEHLKQNGFKNVELFPLPYDVFPKRDREKLKFKLSVNDKSPIIITHGIVSSHKGLLEMPRAVREVKEVYPDVLWIAANAVSINNITSTETFNQILSEIDDLGITENVIVIKDFLPREIVGLLIQTADIGVLAYSEVGESASAAVRKFLASGTPTIVTDIPMMAELRDEVLKIKDNRPATIASAVKSLWKDKALQTKLSQAALLKSDALSWDKMAIKLLKIYSELEVGE